MLTNSKKFIPLKPLITRKEMEDNKTYLAKNYIFVYMEDAMFQYNLHFKKKKEKPAPVFLAEYFHAVKQGTHILLREWKYIVSTPYNRKCVIDAFYQTYQGLKNFDYGLSIDDLYSLVQFLWTDFPKTVVVQAMGILTPPGSNQNVTHMRFIDFFQNFYLQFIYEEFLIKCKDIYLIQTTKKDSVNDEGIQSKSVEKKALLTPTALDVPFKTERLLTVLKLEYKVDVINIDNYPSLKHLNQVCFPETLKSLSQFYAALLNLKEIKKYVFKKDLYPDSLDSDDYLS